MGACRQYGLHAHKPKGRAPVNMTAARAGAAIRSPQPLMAAKWRLKDLKCR
jgi:hypothetical protein